MTSSVPRATPAGDHPAFGAVAPAAALASLVLVSLVLGPTAEAVPTGTSRVQHVDARHVPDDVAEDGSATGR